MRTQKITFLAISLLLSWLTMSAQYGQLPTVLNPIRWLWLLTKLGANANRLPAVVS